jgi:hypothetical protein
MRIFGRLACEECAHAKRYSTKPSSYEIRVADWAFSLSGLAKSCRDAQEFAKCALGIEPKKDGKCPKFKS